MSRLLDPVWPFMQLRRELSHLIDNLESNGGSTSGVFPPLNVWEDRDNYYAEAEIPGVAQEDLEVFTIGDELTIRGKREPMSGKGLTYHRQERGWGQFERVVSLPGDVDADKVEAHLHHGVLKVILPKAEEAKPRKITVTAA
ncbi:MAG TPA: Hsp20/alpha crystallin family protein [Phycisphaerae bacterium]|nr:Hsp20/alpha crystallin family protein [Phycisphaerae bacterium]HOQ86461.1 Hsp20/alpha crystallin family protein [Phycisphaerae bacterium]HPU26422.1 Hsp20/alpha crystallin family protein [Phycisphaerae bacterium]HQE28710.1 Hsp20/alpha crystallin family protein [Phycisphaerae bacterium]